MENRREIVEEHLSKHFSYVYTDDWDDDITAVCCRLSSKEDKEEVWLYFPFHDDEFIGHNPYDIVNAIWEYITEYML